MYTKGKTILIVDDDQATRGTLKQYLEREGFEIWEAQDGEEALTKFKRDDPCFVILDLELSKIPGEVLCQTFRSEMRSEVPIMILSAKSEEDQVIKVLRMGADDYVTKPFNPDEVVARVEAVLRRTANRCARVSYRGITIRPIRGIVKYKGEEIILTNHEFKLLYFLLRHPNQILTREQIIDELYPNHEKAVTERTIDVHIAKLREKIPACKQEELIETVRGRGYRFNAY